MKSLRITGTLLTATCVVGLVGAASAMALSTNNPQWLVLASVLLAGQAVAIDAEANGVQDFNSTGLTIECKKFRLAAGAVLIGSNAPAPGISEEGIRYLECEFAGFPACKINGAVPGEGETKPLRGLLVFLTKSGALNEEADTSGILFKPKTAATFAEFGLSGTCPLTGTVKVEGTGLLVNNLTDNHEVTHELEAPAVAKKAYYLNEGGVTRERTGIKLEMAGLLATYVGKEKVLLASKERWGIFN